MKRIGWGGVVIAGGGLVAGCPKKHNVIDSPNAGSQVSGSTQGEGASTSSNALNGEAGSQGGGMGADAPFARKVIYFDFDKSEIKPEFAAVVAAHARNLSSHPNMHMKLEGNTDERGTREYNIGLGERRAQAVRRALMPQGVTESPLHTVRFGAENPAGEGHNQADLSPNRRPAVVYRPGNAAHTCGGTGSAAGSGDASSGGAGGDSSAAGCDDKAAYRTAFNLVKDSQYDRAIAAFQKFLIVYSASSLGDTAQYWLGEASCVNKSFPD